MSRELDNALNDCLERVSEGAQIEECVARYPGYREELRSLLRTAMSTMRVATSVSYSPQARARGLSRLTRVLAESGVPKRRGGPFALLRPMTRPLAVGFAAVLLTVIAAGGTAVASSNSVPGERLYWFKTARENITLRFPRSDIEQAHLSADLASERGREMRLLVARGNVGEAERLVVRMRTHLNESAHYAGISLPPSPRDLPIGPGHPALMRRTVKLRAILERDGGDLRKELAELMQQVPPSRQFQVRQLMRRSELGYQIVIGALRPDRSSQGWPIRRSNPSGSTPQ